MRAWLEQPVTRAGVIGWVRAVPAVIYIGVLGAPFCSPMEPAPRAR